MTILYIDTRERNQVAISLIRDGKKYNALKKKTNLSSQILLPLIDKVIKTAGSSLSEIDEIKIEEGPGSFTGLRVGISIANALSYSLGIKVNGKNQLIVPKYK